MSPNLRSTRPHHVWELSDLSGPPPPLATSNSSPPLPPTAAATIIIIIIIISPPPPPHCRHHQTTSRVRGFGSVATKGVFVSMVKTTTMVVAVLANKQQQKGACGFCTGKGCVEFRFCTKVGGVRLAVNKQLGCAWFRRSKQEGVLGTRSQSSLGCIGLDNRTTRVWLVCVFTSKGAFGSVSPHKVRLVLQKAP
ncbi:hypothetical protein Tco_0143723 [Tanacetum coccineum]